MKTTHIVASKLFLLLWLAGCANLPMDQACRTGIEKESKVLNANGHKMRDHRSPDFFFLLSAAEGNELVGDYQSCLNNLKMARIDYRHGPSRNYYPTRNTYTWAGKHHSNEGAAAYDAAHHAAGHTHHHGH